MNTYIMGGRIIDPSAGLDAVCDIGIEGAVIKAIGHFKEIPPNELVIDAKGHWVVPGLIDLHAHLREPGQSHKETILTGARAAVAGGFTTICCMPNTSPSVDSPDVIQWIVEKAARAALTRILPVAAITLGQQGTSLSPMEGLVKAGAVAFSEDGKSVEDAALMKEAFKRAAALGVPVLDHCEDADLVKGGVVRAGRASVHWKVPGIPAEAETAMVEREIKLAKDTGVRLHICHVSAAETVETIRRAQQDALGFSLTAEVCPHHFTLCDEDILSDDGNYKMNPPLGTPADRRALQEGLQDGVLSVIATDHAPHHAREKDKGLLGSAFGITGLETAVGLGITELVSTGILTPAQWVAAMTINPARILGVDSGTLMPGKRADVTIIDPKALYPVSAEQGYSLGKNTPFDGRLLTGRVLYTLMGGRVVYNAKE